MPCDGQFSPDVFRIGEAIPPFHNTTLCFIHTYTDIHSQSSTKSGKSTWWLSKAGVVGGFFLVGGGDWVA